MSFKGREEPLGSKLLPLPSMASPPLRYDVPLAPLTTFGVPAKAERFLEVDSLSTLQEALKMEEVRKERKLILGGGSNVLFTRDQEGTVLHNSVPGIEQVQEDEETVLLKVGGGENWHRFVRYCVEKGLGGVENLSLIPGRVGAAPMQNIGAYGVELKEVFESLEAVDLESGKVERFGREDCEFAYRSSIFKTRYKDRFLILNVTLRLSRFPQFNVGYGALREELEQMGVNELSVDAIIRAVIQIRQRKLPDPERTGNAGSFFKNPVVEKERYEELSEAYPDLKAFSLPDGRYKVAAGWLIEKAGWKGKRMNDHGVHDKQALVLVNYGKATGMALKELAERIQASVEKEFGVQLDPEVNIL